MLLIGRISGGGRPAGGNLECRACAGALSALAGNARLVLQVAHNVHNRSGLYEKATPHNVTAKSFAKSETSLVARKPRWRSAWGFRFAAIKHGRAWKGSLIRGRLEARLPYWRESYFKRLRAQISLRVTSEIRRFCLNCARCAYSYSAWRPSRACPLVPLQKEAPGTV